MRKDMYNSPSQVILEHCEYVRIFNSFIQIVIFKSGTYEHPVMQNYR